MSGGVNMIADWRLAIANWLTLKALANFSPGLFQPWVQKAHFNFVATLSGLRHVFMTCAIPGLPERNPGLTFANTFGVSNSCYLRLPMIRRAVNASHAMTQSDPVGL